MSENLIVIATFIAVLATILVSVYMYKGVLLFSKIRILNWIYECSKCGMLFRLYQSKTYNSYRIMGEIPDCPYCNFETTGFVKEKKWMRTHSKLKRLTIMGYVFIENREKRKKLIAEDERRRKIMNQK